MNRLQVVFERSESRYANAVIGPVSTILETYLFPEVFATGQYKALLNSMSFAGIIVGQLCEPVENDATQSAQQ